jgi:ubiquinone/menaquinone biosynthesis C-methylase UbiE
MAKDGRYVPALGWRRLAGFYDPVVRRAVGEEESKRRLLERVALSPARGPAPDGTARRALDLGCGTATLTLRMKQREPAAEVVGLDGDREMLGIARAKAAAGHRDLPLVQAMSFRLPFPDGSFDRIVSSLLFHHLTRENKRRTLREVWRVLRPGGTLHIVDFGPAKSRAMRLRFLLVQLVDGFETTGDSLTGILPRLLQEAGFANVEEWGRQDTAVGTLSFYEAARPAAAGRPAKAGEADRVSPAAPGREE